MVDNLTIKVHNPHGYTHPGQEDAKTGSVTRRQWGVGRMFDDGCNFHTYGVDGFRSYYSEARYVRAKRSVETLRR